MGVLSTPPEERREAGTQYFYVTPAGAFYATLSAEPEEMRALLLQLLSADTAIPVVPGLMARLTGLNQDDAEAMLDRLISGGMLELRAHPDEVATGALEQMLPKLIGPLGEGKVLLADEQGFALAQKGFSAEEAEALAALAADLLLLHERHQRLTQVHLELFGCSWALVNSVGQSELGFWVINVGREKFLLVIEGMPYLNRHSFVDLASVLIRRYLDH